jgi:hypothetical protein
VFLFNACIFLCFYCSQWSDEDDGEAEDDEDGDDNDYYDMFMLMFPDADRVTGRLTKSCVDLLVD